MRASPSCCQTSTRTGVASGLYFLAFSTRFSRSCSMRFRSKFPTMAPRTSSSQACAAACWRATVEDDRGRGGRGLCERAVGLREDRRPLGVEDERAEPPLSSGDRGGDDRADATLPVAVGVLRIVLDGVTAEDRPLLLERTS